MRRLLPEKSGRWLLLAGLLAAAGGAWMTRDRWLPAVRDAMAAVADRTADGDGADPGHAAGHAGHGHDHAGHDDDVMTALELSDQARRNIGLSVGEVELENFERTINVPAMVVERPGRTKNQIATPMTGVVTHVYVIQGEAARPGSLMFKIRLTHEDLVDAQSTFLETLGELDVENREIERLESITAGVIAGQVILEHKYKQERLNALLDAQREALLLHGLSKAQVEQIESSRKLLRELQIFAPSAAGQPEELRITETPFQQVSATLPPPPATDDDSLPRSSVPYVIQNLRVHRGQSVLAGETLCVLADFSELYIEGKAFEHDADELHEATRRGWTVSAVREDNQKQSEVVRGLEILYVANEVDPVSRALNFYVGLPNIIVRDETTQDGHHFIDWKYKPGQRLQLRVPVELWEAQIVLPADAVTDEGVENYVFLENGGRFERVPVHVKFRDQYSVVIANDGSIFPGDRLALSGAHQMQVALKNKAGGGVDPHAGHSH